MIVRISFADGTREDYEVPPGTVELAMPFVDDAGRVSPREKRTLYLSDAERPAKKVEILNVPKPTPPPELPEMEEYAVTGKEFLGRHCHPDVADKIVYRGKRPKVH